jgi:hypothetical protein
LHLKRPLKKTAVVKVRDPFSSIVDELQFDLDGFFVGDVTSKKALMSKINDKNGS